MLALTLLTHAHTHTHIYIYARLPALVHTSYTHTHIYIYIYARLPALRFPLSFYPYLSIFFLLILLTKSYSEETWKNNKTREVERGLLTRLRSVEGLSTLTPSSLDSRLFVFFYRLPRVKLLNNYFASKFSSHFDGPGLKRLPSTYIFHLPSSFFLSLYLSPSTTYQHTTLHHRTPSQCLASTYPLIFPRRAPSCLLCGIRSSSS